jgi:hypothetical protein
MLKPQRFEKNSSVCYIAALSFVAVFLITMLFNYVHLEAYVEDAGKIVSYDHIFNGYQLLTLKNFRSVYVSVASYLNLLTLIMSGIMVLSVAYGVLSSNSEAWTKSLIIIQVALVFCIIFTLLCPFQLWIEVTECFGPSSAAVAAGTLKVGKLSFGFMPWVAGVAAIAAFVVVQIFVKKGKFKVK